MNATRRRFLSLLAGPVAVTAAAAAAAPAIAAVLPASTGPIEPAAAVAGDPALLALAERADHLLKDYRDAAAHHATVRAVAIELLPVVPDDLRPPAGWGPMYSGCIMYERDVDGIDLELQTQIIDGKEWAVRPPVHFDGTKLKRALEGGNLYAPPRTKVGKQVRKWIDLSERYEADRAEAIARAGLDEAREAMIRVVNQFQEIVWEASTLPPNTPLGVLAFARILSSCAAGQQMPQNDQGYYSREGMAAAHLGCTLAEATLRLAVQS